MAGPVTAPLIKRPEEVRNYAVNFGFQPEMRAGDTLSGPVVTVTIGVNPPTLGTPTIAPMAAGPLVQFTISGGQDAVDYTILCIVNTSSGAILAERVTLQVRAGP